jgi:putative addiction module component (TIGR02574 family)
MMAISTPQEIIASALQLPAADREQVVDALQDSLIDENLDHGPSDSPAEVRADWSNEIARRLADIDAGRVATVPAEKAEWMIRADVRPSV